MAIKAYGLSWRLTRDAADRAFPRQDARDPGPLSRPGDRHVHRRRVPVREESRPGHRAVRRGRSHVLAGAPGLAHRRSGLRRPARTHRLQRPAGDVRPDMWSHQYDQQVNQVQCTINPDHMWSTNGPESNLFGLEPNYGCCTANLHQGWPKFVAHLWMRTAGEGIAAVAYAPSTARVHRRRHARVSRRPRPITPSAKRSR